MPLPTDRGYVVVSDDAGGTKTVQICTDVRDGVPQDVFATHVRTASLVIHPEVAVEQRNGVTWTRDVVQVYAEGDGSVHVTDASRSAIA